MRYDSFRFIKPPRAEEVIPPNMLSFYESQSWVAQVKMNGAYNVIFCNTGEKKLIALNREGKPHKAWNWTEESADAFWTLPKKGWYVFCAELLHSKGPEIKDTNYLHDVLVWEGRHLIGYPYKDRWPLLKKAFKKASTQEDLHYNIVNQKTWLAKTFWHADFRAIYDSLDSPLEEGLVLKNPKVGLDSPISWQVKCRRKTKNFEF